MRKLYSVVESSRHEYFYRASAYRVVEKPILTVKSF
jgi:hypothetical protein